MTLVWSEALNAEGEKEGGYTFDYTLNLMPLRPYSKRTNVIAQVTIAA